MKNENFIKDEAAGEKTMPVDVAKGSEGEGPAVVPATTDIDAACRPQEEKTQYFDWMMEEYAGNIYICDMETYELLYVNQVACTTLQTPKEKILGRKCYEVIQDRSEPCPFCTNPYLSKDKFYEWEFDNKALGRTFMIKNRIIEWNGRRARIELSCDMLSTEYKLAKKDQERETIVGTIPGVFCRLDARDYKTVLWHGAGFSKLLGCEEDNRKITEVSAPAYVKEDELQRIKETLDGLTETGQSSVMEVVVTPPGGEEKILTVTFSYISGEDSWDGIPSIYSVGIDITEDRIEQERQHVALEDAYQSLKSANSAKTDFLSAISHDIRTPMNAVIGMTAIAEANLESKEKVEDCLKKIKVASRHLLSLISEVLDMSKIESGRIDLTPQYVELPELIQNTCDMFRTLMEEKQQEFHVIVGQVRHEKVVADGDRLSQVFANLLSNAMKYTPEGGRISMEINELPSLIPGKGWYEFIFRDTGIGMSEDYLPHLFEPFTRAEGVRDGKTQGTGLGMSITENIVSMMNGTIDVKSRLGEGSCFTVSLPLQLLNEEEESKEELLGLPVLIVDDDQIVCESAAVMLNELGMKGYWVSSGAEAVRRIVEAEKRADDFFAVILDWQMPGMDGLDTLKAIRKQVDKNIPIIIISAYDYSGVEEEFIQAGADAFITKPLFQSKVLHVLKMFCVKKNKKAEKLKPEEEQSILCGKRLLLAEDNEINREIAEELLEMRGIAVDSAENGALAAEMFRKSEAGYYTAVLMDIQMPVMDGYEATAAIRAMPRKDAASVPIIALTANAFVADIGKAQNAGMNAHVPKPIDMEKLLATIETCIGQ
ncbi:hybrid sensor histidine kinase/response regulator [Dorea sp. D27]|uniref:hybrid sensor histidine kinase/response regulator n=1 Tax=Dorea sp. D27 TaxID=658665 RepID=UPI001FA71E12|nr:response regulator [Dorea sp. D27]